MRADIDAIAFDIDGTLYPDAALHWRILPFVAANLRLMLALGAVREEIRVWQTEHPGEKHADFLGWQAFLLAPRLGCVPDAARRLLMEKIYDGWRPIFARIRPYPGVAEAFAACRDSGLRLGILSDFLPSQKGDLWGLAPLCDAIIGSEETGALKPSPVPFLALSERLGVPCERILYVGNSPRADVRGAAAVGMKTACLVSRPPLLPRRRVPGADISFRSYRQLISLVLN